jgi:hypothetical protein
VYGEIKSWKRYLEEVKAEFETLGEIEPLWISAPG